jgi:hypothetical protein
LRSEPVELIVLSGGAAQGRLTKLSHRFRVDTGCTIAGTFGAVGAMRARLLAGAPADLMILTSALIAELTRSGHVRPGSAVDIGVVCTGLAVRAGDAMPPLGDAAALRSDSPLTPSTSRTPSARPPASTSPRCSTRSASPYHWQPDCGHPPTGRPPWRRRLLLGRAPSAARWSPRSSTRRA